MLCLGLALALSRTNWIALNGALSVPDAITLKPWLCCINSREALAAGFGPARQFYIYAGLGDKDRAFEALDRAVTINPRSWRVATWMIRPEMKILRGDPRFQAIRKRLGLPE